MTSRSGCDTFLALFFGGDRLLDEADHHRTHLIRCFHQLCKDPLLRPRTQLIPEDDLKFDIADGRHARTSETFASIRSSSSWPGA